MNIEIERPAGENSPRAVTVGGLPESTAASLGALKSSQSLGADCRSQVPTSQEMSAPAEDMAGGPASTGAAALGAGACCSCRPREHPRRSATASATVGFTG